ncbi:MAG TPA: nuclear transport factor 2 family protein [Devosiaceae bacterium]
MTGSPDHAAQVDAYARAFAALEPAGIAALMDLCSDDVIFRDPFNDTVGKDRMRAVFEDMFAHASTPRFEVLDRFGQGRRWILKWRFTATVPVIGALDVTGLSELTLSDDGKVASHLDYWDTGPAIYGRVPVLGTLVNAVRRRLSASR